MLGTRQVTQIGAAPHAIADRRDQAVADQRKTVSQYPAPRRISIRPEPDFGRQSFIVGSLPCFTNDQRTPVRCEFQNHKGQVGTDAFGWTQFEFRPLAGRAGTFSQVGLHDAKAHSAVEQRAAIRVKRHRDPPRHDYASPRDRPRSRAVDGGRGWGAGRGTGSRSLRRIGRRLGTFDPHL